MTVTLLQVGPTTIETRFHILLDGARVGVAVEIAADRVCPWRITIPGICANLRRSSREIVIATVERLLTDRDRPAQSVVYVPTSPHGHWHAIAAELRQAGFEIRPAPGPDLPRHAVTPLVLVSSREG